jgi:hypothetical protein
MWNGFYSLKHINDIDKLKSLYKDALNLSISASVHKIPDGSYQREHCTEISPIEYIEKYITFETHNVIVNRYVQSGCQEWSEKLYEVASTVLLGRPLYLFIQVELDKMDELILKYKLVKNER